MAAAARMTTKTAAVAAQFMTITLLLFASSVVLTTSGISEITQTGRRFLISFSLYSLSSRNSKAPATRTPKAIPTANPKPQNIR